MKNYKCLLYLIFILAISFSCQTESEKRIEIATKDFIRFIDSVTKHKKEDAKKNWESIEKNFEEKLKALNMRIDSVEETSEFESKIDSATLQFEAYRESVLKNDVLPSFEHNLEKEYPNSLK